MEKSDEPVCSVVKIDIRIYPPIFQPVAIWFVLHNADWQPFAITVDAFVKSSSEELDSHDAEDEPEHHAHQQYIANPGNCKQQRIHHNLCRKSQIEAVKIYSLDIS